MAGKPDLQGYLRISLVKWGYYKMGSKKDSKKQRVEILIVEDSPTQAMKLEQQLERKNFRVSVAQNGREALTILKKLKPALIISDILMPEMDGFELCQKIKTDKSLKDIPVILLTTLSEPEDIIHGLTSGAENFVTKPYDEKFLLSRIDYVLANRELRQKVTLDMGIEIYFSGQRHLINSDRLQILDLLFSTYEGAIQKSRELERSNKELRKTQDELKELNEQLERKVLERTQRISHLNSSILAVRNVNQLIAKEKDRYRLIQGACESLISTKSFYHAWIALVNDSGKVVMTSEAGLGDKFLPVSRRLKRGKLTACGKRALPQPELVTIEDRSSFCGDCPLADGNGDSGAMCIRLEHGDKVYGFLTVSVPVVVITDKEEQALFKEVAGDIGFALHSLELEEERKRAEKTLRFQDEVVKNMIEGLYLIRTSDGVIIYANSTFERMFGYNAGELIGKNVSIVNAPGEKTPEKTANEIIKSIKENGIWSGEVQNIKKDGTQFWCYANVFSLDHPIHGQVWVSMHHDITERRRAEEALRKERNLLDRIMETSPAGITMIDRQGRITFANPRAEEVLGLNRDEITKRLYNDPEWRITDYEGNPVPDHKLPFQQVMSTGQPVYDVRHAIAWPDGKQVLLSINSSPLFDISGRVDGVVNTVEDITKEIELENQLRHAQKMESIGQLAGGVAHDFNNILTSIMGFSSLLKRDKDLSEKTKKRILEIEKASHRAAEIVKQLLTFSRKKSPALKTMDLNDLVKQSLGFLKKSLGPAFKIESRLDESLGMIKADSTQVQQVLMNLCVNARDAMSDGGTIIIEICNMEIKKDYAEKYIYAEPGPKVVLSVTDTGTGMDDETISRIFDPFFTTKEIGKGTGLGMSIVYGLVKDHGGTIQIYSEVGHGTTVKIYFPRVSGDLDREEKIEAEVRGGKETILIVDDDELVLNLASSILEDYGYKYLIAKGGPEALDIFRKKYKSIDLVLLDFVMPRMSGREVIEEMLKVDPNVAVIMSSGFAVEDENVFLERGIKALVSKPYDEERLARVIREILDKRINRGAS